MLTAHLMTGRLKFFPVSTEDWKISLEGKSFGSEKLLKLGLEGSVHFYIVVSQRTSVCKAAVNIVRLYIQREALRSGDRYYAQTSFQSSWNHTVLIFNFFFFWFINSLFAFDFCERWFPHDQQKLGNFQGSGRMLGQVFEPRGSCWILLWDCLFKTRSKYWKRLTWICAITDSQFLFFVNISPSQAGCCSCFRRNMNQNSIMAGACLRHFVSVHFTAIKAAELEI